MKKKINNHTDVKVFNRILIRDIIRKMGPIARYELAKETGLTPPTITVIVNQLIKHGIVIEVGYGESSGGRRPVMLELNSKLAYIFAVRLQRDEVVTALFDLGGNICNQHNLVFNTAQADEVVEEIGRSFDQLVSTAGIHKENVLFCGVASPGLINIHRGLVKHSANLKWNNIPIGAMLSKRLYGTPVRVENISNAAAFAEKEYGSGRDTGNLIYVNLSVGVGAGIIIKDELYGGIKGYAGEIGHLPVIPPGTGPQCVCGRYGCLESLCGVRAILDQVKEILPNEVFEKQNIIKSDFSMADLLLPVFLENMEVQNILEQAAKRIGMVMSNLVSIFNPELIILGGELPKTGDRFTEVVIQEMNKHLLHEFLDTVRVVKSSMEEEPALIGAYALASNTLFSIEKWDL